jgi:hypothetical protein
MENAMPHADFVRKDHAALPLPPQAAHGALGKLPSGAVDVKGKQRHR